MELKKYSEMTFEEFLTEVLEIKLTKEQIHLVKIFNELKNKKEVTIINPLLPIFKNNEDKNPLDSPFITNCKTLTNDDKYLLITSILNHLQLKIQKSY